MNLLEIESKLHLNIYKIHTIHSPLLGFWDFFILSECFLLFYMYM